MINVSHLFQNLIFAVFNLNLNTFCARLVLYYKGFFWAVWNCHCTTNKNAFQYDAYRPLVDCMLESASLGGLPGPGGGCLPGPGDLAGPGGSAWSGGVSD